MSVCWNRYHGSRNSCWALKTRNDRSLRHRGWHTPALSSPQLAASTYPSPRSEHENMKNYRLRWPTPLVLVTHNFGGKIPEQIEKKTECSPGGKINKNWCTLSGNFSYRKFNLAISTAQHGQTNKLVLVTEKCILMEKRKIVLIILMIMFVRSPCQVCVCVCVCL